MALLLLLLPGTGGTKAEVRPTRAAAKAMMAALESFMIVTWTGAVGVWVGGGSGKGSVRSMASFDALGVPVRHAVYTRSDAENVDVCA